MRAHINGITVDGTPQEIMEYQMLRGLEMQLKPLRINTSPYNPRPIDKTDASKIQYDRDYVRRTDNPETNWDGIWRN